MAAFKPREAERLVSPILIFGSQGADFLSSFDPLFQLASRYPILQMFFETMLEALREDIKGLGKNPPASADRNSHNDDHGDASAASPTRWNEEMKMLSHLPPIHHFDCLAKLVAYHRSNELRDPVVNGVLLVLLQLGSLVAASAARGADDDRDETARDLQLAWNCVNHPDAQLLGFCTGIVSASALRRLEYIPQRRTQVFTSNTWQFVDHAVEAVRLCFWIGLRSKMAGEKLSDGIASQSSGSWSAVLLGCTASQADELVHVFNTKMGAEQGSFDPAKRIVVTAYAGSSVSIGGLFPVVDTFCDWMGSSACPLRQVRASKLHIFSPYHNQLLQPEIDNVIEDLKKTKAVEFDEPEIPWKKRVLWDTVSALPFDDDQNQEQELRRLVETNLSHAARWSDVTKKMASNPRLLANHEAGRATTDSDATNQDLVLVSVGPAVGLTTAVYDQLINGPLVPDLRSTRTSVRVLDLQQALQKHASSPAMQPPQKPLWSLGSDSVHGDDIAVVSMACRFPGDVSSPEKLWTCLETGRETVSEIPKHLFDIDKYYGNGVNQTLARHMHALSENVTTTMDARLFSMSPREVEQLDPQHRLTMLCAYEALERAGYTPESSSPSSFDRKRIGIWMGASWDDYRENASHNIGSYFITGNIRAFIPGHVSFSLKWEGPSISVDSAECSAVSAISCARRALMSGQCDVALAGAVNVLTQPQIFIAMDKDRTLSRRGRNATFCSDNDGAVRGDGCGILLLKRLSTAIADGDNILATIPVAKETNFSVFNQADDRVKAQTDTIDATLKEARLSTESIVHVEASGHHSVTEEAVEFLALDSVFGQGSTRQSPLTVSSTRPNLGAGEAVSAMAGIIKAILILQKGSVPRQLGLTQIEPTISSICDRGRLSIPREARNLSPTGALPNHASILINSISSAGSQGVVIVQQPPLLEEDISRLSTDERSCWVFTLSAKTEESVHQMRGALVDYLYREANLSDLSYTLTARRIHHPFRLTVVAGSHEELMRGLRQARAEEARPAEELPGIGVAFGPLETLDGQVVKDCRSNDRALRDLHERYVSCAATVATEAGQGVDDHRVALESMLFQLALFDRLQTCNICPCVLAATGTGCLVALAAARVIDSATACLILGVFKLRPRHIQSALGVIMGKAPSLAIKLIQEDFELAAGAAITADIIQTIINELEASARTPFHRVQLTASNHWIRMAGLESSSKVTNGTATDDTQQMLLFRPGSSAFRCLTEEIASLHQRGYYISWYDIHHPYLTTLKVISDLPTYRFQLQRYWMDYVDRNLIRHHLQPGDEDYFDSDDSGVAGLDGKIGEALTEEELREAELRKLRLWPPHWSLLEACTHFELNEGVQEVYELRYEASVHSSPLKQLMEGHDVHGSAIASATTWAEAAVQVATDIGERFRKAGMPCPFSECQVIEVSELSMVKPLILQKEPDAKLTIRASGGVDSDAGPSSFDVSIESSKAGQPNTVHFTCHISAGEDSSWRALWSRLQPLVKSRIDEAQKQGELISHRLVYKMFSNTVKYSEDSGYRGITKLHLLRHSSEVATQVRFEYPKTFDASGFVFLPSFVDALSQCTGWLCNAIATTDSEEMFMANGMHSMRLSSGLTVRALGARTGNNGMLSYTRMVVDPADDKQMVGDAYFIDPESGQIIGEMEGVRFKRIPARAMKVLLPGSSAARTLPAHGGPTPRQDTHAPQLACPAAQEPQAMAAKPRPSGRKAKQAFERAMTSIAEELGVPPEELKPTAKFADLGLDSLMSLVCISTLESLDLGFAIPPSMFMDYNSPQELEAWILAQLGEEVVFETDGAGPLEIVEQVATTVKEEVADTSAAWSEDEVGRALTTLCSVLELELGVEKGTISAETQLADLGLDSLMALLVLGSLASEFNFELPPSLFMDYPTLKDIREFFKSQLGNRSSAAKQEVQDQTSKPQNLPAKAPEHFPRTEPKMPVRIQAESPGSGRKALFLLPDGSGSSGVFNELNDLGRALYGPNSAFLNDASKWKHGVRQIAQYYLDCIKLVQPKGPYLLGGWSFGGNVAFEVAQILSEFEDPSDRLDLLLLIDSPAPNKYPPLPMGVLNWIFGPEETAALSSKLKAHFQATIDNLASYRPQKLFVPPKHVAMMVAKQGYTADLDEVGGPQPTAEWMLKSGRDRAGPDGWDELIASNIEIRGVNANHFLLMRDPEALQELSAHIKEACDAAERA